MSRSLGTHVARVAAGVVVALVGIGLSATQLANAGTPTLYLDARYNFTGTKVVGPREVYIVGPNPFKTKWTVSVEATAIPAPDLTTLASRLLNVKQKGLGNGGAQLLCRSAAQGPLEVLHATKDNFQNCIDAFQNDIASLSSQSQVLQKAEQHTSQNVEVLLTIPGTSSSNTPDPAGSPAPDSDQQTAAQFVQRYEGNLNLCVINYVSPSPSPQPSDPTYDGKTCTAKDGSGAALQPDGNIPAIQSAAKAAQGWDETASSDYSLLSDLLDNNADYAGYAPSGQQQSYKTQLTVLKDEYDSVHSSSSGLLTAAGPTNPASTPGQDAVFVPAPGQSWMGTFVFHSADNPTYSSCHGYLFSGVALKYTLSVSSPSPSPSPTTSTEPTGTQSSHPHGRSRSKEKYVAYDSSSVLDAGQVRLAAQPSPVPRGGQRNTQSDQDKGSESQTPSGMTAEVDCLSIAFVSTGYALDGVPNVSYTAVPDNSSGSGKSKMATIQKSAHGPRSVITSLANFQIGQATDNGSSFAYTLGLGLPVTNPGPGWKFEIVTGPSYTIARTFTITVGAAFGSSYELQPGYSLGGPIPLKMAPPTSANNFTPGWIVSGSFYIPTGGTQRPQPSSTPQKKNKNP